MLECLASYVKQKEGEYSAILKELKKNQRYKPQSRPKFFILLILNWSYLHGDPTVGPHEIKKTE